MQWWIAYLGIGLVVGYLAGLLGIGGGAVIVPMLVWVFAAQGIPGEHQLHIALGTSLATIVFTSLASMRAHHSRGSVDWQVVRAMTPGIITGAFGAALVAGSVPTRPLAVVFTVLAFLAATQIFLDVRPKTSRGMPGFGGLFAAGATVGAVSSLLSVGGAFLTVPFLSWCGVELRRAIGTAAANALPIAVAGTAGYILQGLRVSGLPPASAGYVYLPALGLLVATSMLAAPLGARAAYRISLKPLRVLLGVVMYGLALRMLASLW